MKNIKIFVATHVKFELPVNDSIYVPIQGGAELYPDQRFGYLLDNTGENISLKKENFNELTSLYWAWKNDDSDVKGLCHYRRYLSKGGKLGSSILSGEDVNKYLSEYDVILPYPLIHKGFSNKQFMLNSNNVFEGDLEILREVINRLKPEYLSDYDVIMNRDYASYCNMFIANHEIFNDYASWLFTILETVENHIDLSGRSLSQIRLYGYLGELLLNVYLYHNKYSVAYSYMDWFREYGLRDKIQFYKSRSKLYYYLKYKRIVDKHCI